MQDKDYSYLMFTLTSGLLLLSGSLAGICLHTSLGRLCCGSDADMRRAMMIFNTSFAFIAVGIYYMVSKSSLDHLDILFVCSHQLRCYLKIGLFEAWAVTADVAIIQ
jgi:hypothetical protein